MREERENAWLDPSIPAQQRALSQSELFRMAAGAKIEVYDAFRLALAHIPEVWSSILDVGCGVGHYWHYLRGIGLQPFYFGVDISPAMIAEAVDWSGTSNHFMVGDGANLYMACDDAFDVVVSSGVILHVPNPADHIREAARVSRKWVVVHRTPILKTAATKTYRRTAYGVVLEQTEFNEGEILKIFAANNLEVHYYYEWEKQGDFSMVTYLLRKA